MELMWAASPIPPACCCALWKTPSCASGPNTDHTECRGEEKILLNDSAHLFCLSSHKARAISSRRPSQCSHTKPLWWSVTDPSAYTRHPEKYAITFVQRKMSWLPYCPPCVNAIFQVWGRKNKASKKQSNNRFSSKKIVRPIKAIIISPEPTFHKYL